MKIFGIPIKIEPSFLVLSIFLAASRGFNLPLLVEWLVVVFISILVHELGHALGLAHVDDPKAVMHEILSDQDLDTLTLTSADVRALHAACSRK